MSTKYKAAHHGQTIDTMKSERNVFYHTYVLLFLFFV